MKRLILLGMALAASCMSLGACGRSTQNVIEEEIIIDGLSKEYDILFLTDTHVIVMDEKDTPQVRENALAREAGFRSSDGTVSSEQLEKWISYANKEKVDGVFLGGDIIDYPSDANIEFLKKQLESLKMPYLYTLGNHDWTYPWDYMTENGKNMYLPMLGELLDHNPSVHTLDYGEFIVLAVDNSSNQINEEALAECTKVMAEGKPVIIMLHVPLLTQSVLGRAKEVWGEGNGVVLGGGNYGGIYPDETSQKFVNLITAEDSPVVLVLAGHVHFYDRDYIDGGKDILQIVGEAGYKGGAVRLRIKG